MMKKDLVFATANAHKVREIQQIVGEGYRLLSLKDIGCAVDIPETADTLEGNALLKAMFVKQHYGYDCFAEDTGLEVKALGGKPGVNTARYAGESKDPQANISLLLKELSAYPSARAAQFRTVIALVQGEEVLYFEGIAKGAIAHEQHGKGGFGYDPIFIPENETRTFAEMSDEEKNSISHRAKAVEKLLAVLQVQRI